MPNVTPAGTSFRKRLASFAGQDGCWLWNGATKNGYGYTTLFGVTMNAHRAAYLIAVGPIPNGLDVCHRCDVRLCIRPDHLFTGTRKENMEDCVSKGRSTKGEKNASAKLTEEQVLAIRADTRFARIVAAEYGVSKPNIEQIRRGERWTHLLGAKQ